MAIVFRNADDSIGIVIPSPEILEKHSIRAIAEKDVPEGLPYWIVEDGEIPQDRTFRDAWEVSPDWGEPHGYGSSMYTFGEVGDADDKQ